MRFIALLLRGLCPCVVSVGMSSSVRLLDTVVAVTVMRGLLFVLHVCMLRECEGDSNAGVWDGGCVVVVSAMHVGGTRGSGTVPSTAYVLWMRGVGGVCEMCMCLARGGVGVEGVSGLEDWILALPILWEQGKCWTCVWVVVL